MSSSSTATTTLPERDGRSVGFLSIDAPEGWCIYDELLIEPLKARGWNVVTPRVNWHKWREIDWSRHYDIIVVRSTWDYQDDLNEFHQALNHIQNHHHLLQKNDNDGERKPVIIMNDVETIKWNSRKTYFADLASKGCIVNPSLFLHDRKFYKHLLPHDGDNNTNESSSSSMITRQEFDILIQKSLDVFPEILAKPICGASSFGIVRITREDFASSITTTTKTNSNDDDGQVITPFIFKEEPAVVQLRDGKLTDFGDDIDELKNLFKRDPKDEMTVEFKSKLDFVWCVIRAGKGDYILQPFLETITTHGEWGLFFFNSKNISHAMRKIPKNGDFRVQEEYGAKHVCLDTKNISSSSSSSFDPTKQVDPQSVIAAKKAFQAFPSPDSFLYSRIDLVPIPKEVVKKCVETKWGICFNKSLDDVDSALNELSSSPFVWSIMECELVEPSLYFDLCPEGIENFVNEFCSRFGK